MFNNRQKIVNPIKNYTLNDVINLLKHCEVKKFKIKREKNYIKNEFLPEIKNINHKSHEIF